MRRFELHTEDIVDGERIFLAEGVQFGDGTVALCGMAAFSLGRGYTLYPNGISALAPLFEANEITWLDKEPMVLIAPEESAARHGAEAAIEAEAIQRLEDKVWDGDPLPHE